ncbi:MAG: copper amine oxidase N-terminal domain-containing protein [Caldisericia bacterium]
MNQKTSSPIKNDGRSSLYVTPDFMQIFEVQTVWDSASKTISFEMDVPADAINGLQNTEIVKRSAKFFLKGTQQGDDEIMMLDGLEYVGKPLVISGGFTMLPIKYFAQAFGGDYAWKPEKDEMVIEMKKSAGNGEFVDIRAVFHTGEKEYEIDGEVFEMFAPAEIIDGEFYIPARPVLDHFEVEGTWDADEKSMAFESEVELGLEDKA